jgi:uncharacterized small protein (TIGR04563 family)
MKQNLYISPQLMEEIKREAKRVDRSVSWLIRYAWEKAKQQLESANENL